MWPGPLRVVGETKQTNTKGLKWAETFCHQTVRRRPRWARGLGCHPQSSGWLCSSRLCLPQCLVHTAGRGLRRAPQPPWKNAGTRGTPAARVLRQTHTDCRNPGTDVLGYVRSGSAQDGRGADGTPGPDRQRTLVQRSWDCSRRDGRVMDSRTLGRTRLHPEAQKGVCVCVDLCVF